MNPYANPGISRYLKSTASTTTSSSASNSPNSTPRLNPSNTSSLPSLSRSNSTSTLTNKSSNSNLATHDSDASLDRKQQQQQQQQQQTSTSSIPKLTIPHFKSHERLQQSSNNLQSYNGFTHITSDTNSSLSCDDFFGTTQSNTECESKQSQELSPTSSSPLSTNNNFNTTNIKDAYSLNSSIHYSAQSSKDDPLNSDIELYKADDSLCPDNFIIQKTTSDISNNNNSLRNNSNSSYPRKYTSKLHEKLHGKKSNQKEQLFFEKKDTKPSEKSSNTKNPSKIAQSLKSTNVVCQSSKTTSSIQSNAQTNNRADNNNNKLYSTITQNQNITEQEQQQQYHNDINSARYINPITGSLNRDLDSSEYLPGSGIKYSEQQPQTAFSPEDYLDLITNMNPAQIKLLPFSVRRKVKAIIAGNATQADIQSVSQNLDSILHFSCSNNNSIKSPSSTSCSPNHELLSPSNSGLNLAIDGSVQEDNNNIMQTQIISNSPHNISSSSSSPFSSSSRRQSEDEDDGPLHILPQNISRNSNRFFSTGSPISPNTSLQNDSPYSPTTATTAAMNPRYSSGGTSIPSSPSFSSRRQLENKKRPFRSSTLSVYPSFNSIQRMRDASSSSSRPPTSDFFGTPVSRSSSLRIPQSSSSTNIYNNNNNNNNTPQSFGSYNSSNSFFGSSSLAKGGATPSPAMQFLSRFASAANSPSVSRRGSVVDGQLAASNDSSSSDLGEQVGDFIIGKQIAYGGFSQVKEAHTIVDGKPVVCAVKIMKRKLQNVKDLQTLASSLNNRNGDNNKNNNNESNLETANAAVEYNEYLQSQIDHEVILWRSLSHKNILKLLEVTETKDFTYCFADKISGGTLFDLVKDKYNVGLDTTQALGYAKQLADALLYLHETMHIVHRDVKLENCLIEPASPSNPNKINRLLLCDFGMSEYFVDEDMDKIDAELPPQLLEDDGEDDDDEDENDGDGDILMHDHKKIPKKVVGPAYTSSQMNQYHHHQSKSKHCNNSSNNNQENQSNNNNTTPPQTESRESPNSMASSEDKSKQNNTIMNRTESSSSIYRQQQRSSRPTSRRNSTATNLSNPIMRSSSTVSLNRSALLPSAIGTTDNFGSFPYASPELLESELPIYDPSVDMWAFGVVLYALFMGRLPWNHPLLPILRELITKAEWSEQEVLDHVHSRFKTEIDEACSSSTNGDDDNGGNSVSKFAKFLKSPDFARFEQEMNKNDDDNSTNNEKEEKAEDVMDYNMSEKQGVAAANSSSLSASSFFPTMETNTGGCDEMFNKMVESQSSPDNNNNPISKRQKSDISFSSSSSPSSSINKHNTNLAKYLTHGVVNLLHGCLSKDVGQRFTIRQVIDTKHLSMIE